ncbi:hypothetical protein AB7X38_06100, partial [Providencia vermicola]|uniref:hypothetical protein n=1 Tax=Providencia vermicola TaxID=333965 RepID=UPI0034E5EF69
MQDWQESAVDGVGGDMIKRYHIPQTQKSHPSGGFLTNLMSGSSLLSHGETPHYHRRYGVSL